MSYSSLSSPSTPTSPRWEDSWTHSTVNMCKHKHSLCGCMNEHGRFLGEKAPRPARCILQLRMVLEGYRFICNLFVLLLILSSFRHALGGLLSSSYRQHQESLAAERERRRVEREERLQRIEREERNRHRLCFSTSFLYIYSILSKNLIKLMFLKRFKQLTTMVSNFTI